MQGLQVNCPTCGKKTAWSSDNPYRPFCCKRCKLIDLGEWASENHRISVQQDDSISHISSEPVDGIIKP